MLASRHQQATACGAIATRVNSICHSNSLSCNRNGNKDCVPRRELGLNIACPAVHLRGPKQSIRVTTVYDTVKTMKVMDITYNAHNLLWQLSRAGGAHNARTHGNAQ
jgi:hypothetical protein